MEQNGNRICFGVFEVRPQARELRKFGLRIKLEDQPFSVLLALLEKPGEVVTRTELRTRIWPDGTFVDFDKSLTKAINKIRAALGDSSATPRFVETLARRGYRFVAPVAAHQTPAAPATEPLPSWGQRRLPNWISVVVLAALLVFAALLAQRAITHPKPAQPIQSVAVLPFVNLTGDASQEYLVDGLTDDLISNLSRIRSLRVISFTSAMHYKGTRQTLPAVAHELSADAVVEGSIQNAGGRLRINAKLVRAATDQQLWSESYQAEHADAALLEPRVALAVANQITAHLTADAAARVTEGGGPANRRAYDAYLHGRYLWNLRGRDAITEAAGYFEQAVREDPKFALAWSGLADTYTIGWKARSDPFLAEKYARKAVALDPNLAEAHISLGFAYTCQRRFPEAEAELRHGGELNPNYVPAHQLYATHLLTLGRLADALVENGRALQLDPFSVPVNNMRALILIGMRQYDRAEEYERTAAQLSPALADFPNNLARIYWLERRIPMAVAAERTAAILESRPGCAALVPRLADLEEAFSKFGFRAASLRLVEFRKRTGCSGEPWDLGLQYALVQDRDKVLGWVAAQIGKSGYGGIYHFKSAPELDFIRSDPQFQDLLRRIGLPP